MIDELFLPNQQKRISYHKEICILIKGKAPENKNKEVFGPGPQLPISFIEYIQEYAALYVRLYGEDGFFTIEKFLIRNIGV